ncbi:MAG: hypothetical protein JST04_02080 [Bdellovibrionales bacterium]|nr:hypothetical protein [Bdellovibrionales bacterium]
MKRVVLSLAALAAVAGSFACVNVFDPIDNPHGEGQLLSAARAAFDKGDVATARELYGKVGTETSTAELAFVDLDSCGADIGAFASALSKASDNASQSGIMLTVMAEHMNRQVSAACFATLLSSYKTARTITDASLRGFTSFLAAIAIAGEVLASNNGISADGILQQADLYGTPSTCVASCAGCAKADGISGAAAVDLSSAGTITATWGTLQGAISAANTAIGELGISTGPSQNLITALNAANPTDAGGLYRCALAQIGVGR